MALVLLLQAGGSAPGGLEARLVASLVSVVLPAMARARGEHDDSQGLLRAIEVGTTTPPATAAAEEEEDPAGPDLFLWCWLVGPACLLACWWWCSC